MEKSMPKRLVSLLLCLTFSFSNLQYVRAQDFNINQLPVPGTMISTTPAYVPLTLKGMVIHPENALKFDFLMDTGNSHLKGNDLSDEALKIMKYFLTALTMPEDDLWVNLSPYEKGRIVQDNFGQTVMGRDLLAEDYVLKQLTASLIYPEKDLGKEFWQQVYSKAAKEYGTTQIPVNTFNKVWIVPSEAIVWEHERKVLIIKSRLKVMLEEDYIALEKNQRQEDAPSHGLASDIVRTIVLPVLEKEINEGKNFAQLRQMYQAMILATWYKESLKTSILNKVYADKHKVAGIGYKDSLLGSKANQSNDIEYIYQQYLKAFKKGAFNYIKEEIDPSTGQAMPRKYFSGGFSSRFNGVTNFEQALITLKGDMAQLPTLEKRAVEFAATENIGPTILVTGDFTVIGSAIPEKKTNDAAMIEELKIKFWKSTGNVEQLSKMLNGAPRAVRRTIMDAIDDPLMGSEKRLRAYTGGLIYTDPSIRSWAIKGLRELGDIRAIDSLIETLNDKNSDSNVQTAVINVLTMMVPPGDSRENNVFKFLKDKNISVREAAIKFVDKVVTDPETLFMTYKWSIGYEPDINGWAIRGFERLKDERAIELLLEVLNSKDGSLREAAVKALTALMPPQDPRGLRIFMMINDKEQRVRLAVMEAIDKLATDKDTKFWILSAGANAKSEVRIWAIKGLGDLGDDRAINQLFEIWVDKNSGIANTVESALIRLVTDKGSMDALRKRRLEKQKEIEEAEKKAAAEAKKIAEAEERMRAETKRKAEEDVKKREDVRKKVTEYANGKTNRQILEVGERATAGEIKASWKRLLNKYHPDRNPQNEFWATEMTQVINQAYQNLNPRPAVPRNRDAAMLGGLKVLFWGNVGNTEQLLKLLNDRNDSVRIGAMSVIDDPIWGDNNKRLQAYLGALQNDSTDIRVWAVNGLGKLNDVRVIELLLGLLEDKSARVREAAINELSTRMSKRGKDQRKNKVFVLLKDNDKHVRQAAMGFVDKMVDDADVLFEIYQWSMGYSPEISLWAIRGLEKLKNDRRVIDVIFEALQDDDVGVRKTAIEVLAKLMTPEDPRVFQIFTMLNDRVQDVRLIAMKTLDKLVIDLDKKLWLYCIGITYDTEVRLWAIRGLGGLKDIKNDYIIDILLWAWLDKDVTVKKFADDALRQLIPDQGRRIAVQQEAARKKRMGEEEVRTKAAQAAAAENKRKAEAAAAAQAELKRKLEEEARRKAEAAAEAVRRKVDQAREEIKKKQNDQDRIIAEKTVKEQMRGKTDYQILEVRPYSTKEEINKAFKRLALKYHPDRNPGDILMEETFKAISAAHDRLDKAMLVYGGIVLNAKMMSLKIKQDGNRIFLSIPQQPLDMINIQGFVPHIISIQPVNLLVLLGLNV